jgi:hypothetical protein
MPYGFTGHGGLTTVDPAFPALGDTISIAFECLQVSDVSGTGSVKCDVKIYTKDYEDTSWGTALSTLTINSTGVKEFLFPKRRKQSGRFRALGH